MNYTIGAAVAGRVSDIGNRLATAAKGRQHDERPCAWLR